MAPPSDDARQQRTKKGPVDPGYATGYETDSVPPSVTGKKSGKTKLKKKKSKAADAGYETDDGYVSSGTTMGKSKKSRLFRLGNRSKTNVQAEEPPPPPPLPEPPAPVFRLPIAARFATTLGDINANATAEPPSIAPQPAAPTIRDVSSPAPTLDSVFIRDAERDSLDVPESTTAHSVDHIQTQVFNSAARRRGHINFAGSSDSSDNHGSTSTAGHSFFSKWTATSTSSASSSSSPQSKHPPISYPLTRSPSPPSPTTVAPQKSNLSQKRVPESLTIDSSLTVPESASRNPSPGGWSPFVVITPNPPGTPECSASPVPNNNVRPLFLARNVNTPSPQRTHLTVDVDPPSPVPSPRARSPAFPISPSQILAQRDLPPPSPPPTVSLPQVPGDQDVGYFSQQQRQRRQFVLNPSVKRGKESPFPSRPVLPSPSATMPGLSARVKVRRYRELYALPKAAWDDDDDAQPVEEMHAVMARFKRASDESTSGSEVAVALERNQSSEALDEMSQYPDEEKSMGRETMYRYENGAQSTGNLSTWSSTGDGRTSIMDIEKSEVARERFVKRIEAMFDENGRERLAVPPVPRLPQAYAKPVRF